MDIASIACGIVHHFGPREDLQQRIYSKVQTVEVAQELRTLVISKSVRSLLEVHPDPHIPISTCLS